MTCPICEKQNQITKSENSLIIDKILLGEGFDQNKKFRKAFTKFYSTIKDQLLEVSQEFNEMIDYVNLREHETTDYMNDYANDYSTMLKTFVLSVCQNQKFKKSLYENSMEQSRDFNEYIKEWYFKNCVDVLLIEMPLLNSDYVNTSISQLIEKPEFSKIFKKMNIITEMLLDCVLSENMSGKKSDIFFINEVNMNSISNLISKGYKNLLESNILTETEMTSYETPANNGVTWNKRALISTGIAAGGLTAAGILTARALRNKRSGSMETAKASCAKIKDDRLRRSCYSKINRLVSKDVDPDTIDDTAEDPGTLYKKVIGGNKQRA